MRLEAVVQAASESSMSPHTQSCLPGSWKGPAKAPSGTNKTSGEVKQSSFKTVGENDMSGQKLLLPLILNQVAQSYNEESTINVRKINQVLIFFPVFIGHEDKQKGWTSVMTLAVEFVVVSSLANETCSLFNFCQFSGIFCCPALQLSFHSMLAM